MASAFAVAIFSGKLF